MYIIQYVPYLPIGSSLGFDAHASENGIQWVGLDPSAGF